MKALIVLAGIYMVGISFAATIHSNNTTDPFEHGNNPTWIEAVGLLFPDVAFVLGSGDSDFELSIDCNPVTVGQNHFNMVYAHLSLYLQQHEAGCWVAFDETADECASRGAFCGSGGGTIQAGMSPDPWVSQCVQAAAYERELCIDALP